MSRDRMVKLRELYSNYTSDEDLIDMIAELRDEFLDHEEVNKNYDHDITPELVFGPEHVLIYLAEYIGILQQQNKHYREAIEGMRSNADSPGMIESIYELYMAEESK